MHNKENIKYQPALHLLQSPELLMSQPLRLCWHVFQYRPWCCFLVWQRFTVFVFENGLIWIACLILFVWICMDQFDVWHALFGRTVKHQGQPIQRSAIVQTCHFNFCQSSDGWGSRCWWYWPLSSWYRCRAGRDATHFGYLWVFPVPVLKGYEGLWRVETQVEPHWTLHVTLRHSAQAVLYTPGIDYSSKCALKASEDFAVFDDDVFFNFSSVHRGLFFEIYRGPAYLRRFSRSPKKRIATREKAWEAWEKCTAQSGLNLLQASRKFSCVAWLVETCWNWQSDT